MKKEITTAIDAAPYDPREHFSPETLERVAGHTPAQRADAPRKRRMILEARLTATEHKAAEIEWRRWRLQDEGMEPPAATTDEVETLRRRIAGYRRAIEGEHAIEEAARAAARSSGETEESEREHA